MADRKQNGSFALRAANIAFILLAAGAFETFLLLSLGYAEHWSVGLRIAVLVFGTVLNGGVIFADLFGLFAGREVLVRSCITAYAMLLVFGAIAYALLASGFLEIARDEGSLKAYLERSGRWMSFAFAALQFLQVVLLPIPSTVTVVAGAALFGAFKGSLLSLVGIVIGSLVAFFIGRFAGQRVVAWLVGKDTLDKWLKKIKGKDKLILTAMFLLPAFPDDVLCFVAGISSMSIWFFLAVILISRIIAIFTTSYSVAIIPFSTWWGILIWAVLFVLVVVLFVFLYKKSDEILAWFERKLKRPLRIEQKPKAGEFTLEIVGPDGAVVQKGVKKEGEESIAEGKGK